MKKIKLLFVVLLVILLCGCGASHIDDLPNSIEDNIIQDTTRKIYYVVDLKIEAKNIEDSISKYSEDAARLKGYVSTSSVESEDYAYVTYRVPTENLNEFLDCITNNNQDEITEKVITSTDITSSYNEVDARLEVLYASRASYLSLLEKASTISDIITIQTRIEEIDSEILKLEKEKSSYDNLVEYSTIKIQIYSKGNGFFNMYLNYIIYLFIAIGIALLYLLPIGIIAFVIVIVYKKIKQKNSKNKNKLTVEEINK